MDDFIRFHGNSKAQSTMIMILLVIAVMLMLFVFMFSLVDRASSQDYANMYAHNLLLSIIRAESGYEGTNCRYVSDLITCAFFSGGEERCGGSEIRCRDAAEKKLGELVSGFQNIKEKYSHLFIIESESAAFEVKRMLIGDEGLDCEPQLKECQKVDRIVANERIIKQTTAGMQNLRVRLVLSMR